MAKVIQLFFSSTLCTLSTNERGHCGDGPFPFLKTRYRNGDLIRSYCQIPSAGLFMHKLDNGILQSDQC